jgi:hypothetical protein
LTHREWPDSLDLDPAKSAVVDPLSIPARQGFGVGGEEAKLKSNPDWDPANVFRDLEAQARIAWRDAFNAGPYSNFLMIDYLTYKSDIAYMELWNDPEILAKTLNEADIKT